MLIQDIKPHDEAVPTRYDRPIEGLRKLKSQVSGITPGKRRRNRSIRILMS